MRRMRDRPGYTATMEWRHSDIPSQKGRVAIVTGANTGIGFETARALCGAGAEVVLACRDPERGRAALERIDAENLEGCAELELLDLASLASVREFAGRFCRGHRRLDLLINNAGVMMPPAGATANGFELQRGINFLGHFALTGLLLGPLLEAADARVVTLSSLAHIGPGLDVPALAEPGRRRPWRDYQQSKLACLMFALELARRSGERGAGLLSAAAHPGATKSDLQRHSGLFRVLASVGMAPSGGALPTLYAATAPGVRGGDYVGPRGLFGLRGAPATAWVSPQARDQERRDALWQAAESATGIRFWS